MSDQDEIYETIEPEKTYDSYDPQPTVVVNQAPQGGSGFAVASLVIGIFSILLSCCGGCFSVVGGIVGLVFGIVSLNMKRQGKGMAIAGVVLSSCAIVIGIIMTVFWVLVSMSTSLDLP